MNLKENYNGLKAEAYAGLQKRKSSGKWILMLEAMPYYLGDFTRGRLLQAVNVAERILDDTADRDRVPPPGYSPVSYLEEKRAFVRNPQSPRDRLDYLFIYCYELADKSGLKINGELDAFFDYFLFDAKRYGTGNIFPKAELDRAYDACDITGTIRGSLMVFGDNPDRAHLLTPIGKATRIYYSLRDYEADIEKGYVNIPRESVDVHGITAQDLRNRFSPPVDAWFREEASEGLRLLDQQRETLGRERFGLRGRFALKYAYEKPTRKYLEAVLRGENLEPN